MRIKHFFFCVWWPNKKIPRGSFSSSLCWDYGRTRVEFCGRALPNRRVLYVRARARRRKPNVNMRLYTVKGFADACRPAFFLRASMNDAIDANKNCERTDIFVKCLQSTSRHFKSAIKDFFFFVYARCNIDCWKLFRSLGTI